MNTQPSPIYGVLAEFQQPGELLAAAQKAHAEGFRRMDAYSPFPIHGLSEAVGFPKTRLPLLVLCGGLSGTTIGFLLQFIYRVSYYPMNVGGRPHFAWPAFIIIMFECTILCASLTAVLGMLVLNGLPQPYHPLFNVPQFGLASATKFFLCIEAKDPKFEVDSARAFMQSLQPQSVAVVPLGPVPFADQLADEEGF